MKKKIKIIVICGSIVLALCITAAVFLGIKSRSKKIINVAFYNLSDNVVNTIQQQILTSNVKNINFTKITDKDINSKKFSQKYDLLFAWQTKTTNDLEAKSKKIPASALNLLPSAIRKTNEKQLPILLDHYEIAYSKDVLNKISQNVPETFAQLEDYLSKASKVVFCPIITEGADEKTFWAFLTSITEALGGYEAYDNLVKILLEESDLDKICEKKLGINGLNNSELTFRDVLDLVKDWEVKGYTHPRWYNITHRDVISFMEDNQVGVLFDSLTFHRQIPYQLITRYGSDRMPVASYRIDHALIAPKLVCLNFDRNSLCTEVLKSLVSEEQQAALSNFTTFAPTASRGESYDRQADDVRFFAASCAYGPQIDVFSAVFEGNLQKAKDLSEQIREYLKIK